MEHDCRTIKRGPMEAGLEFEPAGTARKVVLGILAGLDERQLVPGQRLAETDLALRYDVGRNAVREAMQHLSVRGIIELEANRSPSIRKRSEEHTSELQSLMRISYAVFCLKKKKINSRL